MTEVTSTPATLSDDELLDAIGSLSADDRHLLARLLLHLAEADHRGSHLRRGFSSLHVYCTSQLHYSGDQAFFRIRAARAVRKVPALLQLVRDGSLHLTSIYLLSSHLDRPERDELIAMAIGRSKRELEALLAARYPEPAPNTFVRALKGASRHAAPLPEPPSLPGLCVPVGPDAAQETPPRPSMAQPSTPALCTRDAPAEKVAQAGPATEAKMAAEARQSGDSNTGATIHALATPKSRAVVTPFAAERYKIQFVAGADLVHKLRQAQELMRHQVPDGDIAQIFARALDELIATKMRLRFGARKPKRGAGRDGAAGAGRAGSAAVRGDVLGRPGDDAKTAGEDAPTDGASATRAASAPRGRSRHIPNQVKRAVFERDEGRCAFKSDDGRRCDARDMLEYHHSQPFARGGAHSEANIELRCRRHNALQAEDDYGVERMARFRRGACARSETPESDNVGGTGPSASPPPSEGLPPEQIGLPLAVRT
jgi:hypothetical protein